MPVIRIVELFAGVGGFRLGLEAVSERFKTIWANQWEPHKKEQYAFDCYVSHFGKSKNHVCMDIAKAKEMIPDHDLLVGGFPCQDYSIIKKNSQGIEGSKGVLWWEIDDIIEAKRPKFILLENVDRIIRSPAKQPGRDFSIILRCLYEKGYAVEWRVINAADYGQAQRRRRTFILAYHNSTKLFQHFADAVCVNGVKQAHSHIMNDGILAKAFPICSHNKTFVDCWIDELQYFGMYDLSKEQRVRFCNAGVMMNGRIYSVDVVPQYESPIPLKNILETLVTDDKYFIKDESLPRWRYCKGAKHELRYRKDGTPYYFNEGSVAFPDSHDKPARTLLTSEPKLSRTSHVVCDISSGRLRTLTPLECERLNGFPDGWTNTGMPEQMRYFTMGNALVVPIVTRIGEVLLSYF